MIWCYSSTSSMFLSLLLAWYFMVIGNKNLPRTGSHRATVGAVGGAIGGAVGNVVGGAIKCFHASC